MKQISKRVCALLLLCSMFLSLCPGLALTAAAASIPNSSEAKVTSVQFGEITDGSAPWDTDDEAGNDSGAKNKIVRSFDTVNYQFTVNVAATDTAKSYNEAYVCVTFTLPLTSAQAEFDTAAMAWMENSGKYAYRIIDNGNSQTLVAYKHLENGGQTVVPGTFGENLTVRVKGMANGAVVKPMIHAYIDGAAEANQATAIAESVTVSAAPRYNVKVSGNSSYKDSFNFNTGNTEGEQIAANYGIAGDKLVPGRMMNLAVSIELYNNQAAKGFKGIEIPNGSPITFKLKLSSNYRINTPNPGSDYTAGTTVAADEAGYMPLLYSVDGNMVQKYGTANGDGRVLYDENNAVVNGAPYNVGGSQNSCFNGGIWSAEQVLDENGAPTGEVLVTVSGYEIDVDKMPTMDGDGSSDVGAYGADKGIGVFSAGEFWIVQPFNRLGNDTTDSAKYEIIQDYGQGAFYTTATASDLTLTTVHGTEFRDSEGTNDGQQILDDDVYEAGLELTLPGSLQNRVYYADLEKMRNWGVNVKNQRHGDDVAMTGTEFYLRAGFTYYSRNEEKNQLWFATNFLRFPAEAYELTGDYLPDFIDGAERSDATLTLLYGAKRDGKDWGSFEEMRDATEDQLAYYDSLEALQKDGKTCVAVLMYIQGPGLLIDQKPNYGGLVRAKVRDTAQVNQTYSIVSTSRVWTKAMSANSAVAEVAASVTPGDDGTYTTPSWETYLANRATLLTENKFTNTKGETEWLNSGNIPANNSAGVPARTQYVPATYDEAHVLHPHNSDWGHWGDTMLIVGYKTGVSMVEAQRVNGQEKETYALDRSQREADFIVQPTVSFDKNQGSPEKTTDLTITVTLPKYLSYIEGSSYFGGTYTQSSANGGMRGTVTGGTELQTDVSVNAETGETTLVWKLVGVTVGQAIPPIYYSTFIGSKSPDADCPQGTTSLEPTVTISGTEDNRAFTADNGNLASEGITVTKGSANAFTKSVKVDTVEADGTVDYVIYSSNNATTPEQVYLLDTMPADGQNGSSFAGTYHVTAWKLDTTLCDAGKLAVYYTTDERYRSATAATVPQTEAEGWTKASLGADGTITDMNGKRPAAWAIIGSLDSNKAINIELQIQLEPDLSAFKDNTTYINTISTGELQATAAATVVKRSISGMAWSDDDADGEKNETVDTDNTSCAGTTFYTTGIAGKDDAILFLKPDYYKGIQTTELKQLKVVMSGSSASDEPIKLYFRTDEKGWAEANRFEINNPTLVKDGGEWISEKEKEYVFDLSAAINANWTGVLTEMRLDPLQGNDLFFNIKTITLVMSDGTEQVMDFCTKGAYENYVIPSDSILSGVSYPTAEDYTLPQEAILSTKRPGATFTAADDGSGDIIFTFLETMYAGLSANDIKAVRVVASGDPATKDPMKLYYAAGNQTEPSEARMVTGGYISRDEATYTLDLSSRSDWSGAINVLRLDPLQGANLNVTIKTIMLDLADGTTRTFDLTVPGAWKSFLRVTNKQGEPVYTAETAEVTRDSVKVSLYRKGETGGTTFATGSASNDAILGFKEVMYQNLMTDDVKRVRIVMSGDSYSEHPPQLFYMSGSDGGFSGGKTLSLDSSLRLSKDMKEYVFELRDYSQWKLGEKLTGLRLDPLQAYNESFTIQSIAIELTDGSLRYFDFTTKDAYKNFVSPANLPTVSYAAADDTYVAVTDGNDQPVSTYLGKSVSAKNSSAVQDFTSGSYEFRDLSGGTYMVRMESGTTDLSQFDKATNAVSIYDTNGKLTAAELRDIKIPSTTENYAAYGNDIGFYGKTMVVLNYDRKVTVDVRSFRAETPTVEVASAVDATVWASKVEKTDTKGRTVTFAEVGADGNVTITPYDLIYSKDNPDASVFYRISYPDGTSVIHEIAIKPADVIYYEESNDDLLTFTDGQRGKWYKVTGQYRHDITADDANYDANADGQQQDADSHTDDYDSKYSENENNLYFSAGTARMVNVTTEVKDASLSAAYPSVKFSFYGTGFELVSMGTPYGGVVNVQVYEGTIEDGKKPIYTRAVNTRYGIYYGEQEDGETAPPTEGREIDRLYQGTALVKDDLTYGMYTVVCTPMYSPYFDPYDVGSFDILVDGVRILNPIGAAPEYERTDFNDILTAKVSLFITEYGKTELSDKLEHGPKYEIHLAPEQSVAVAVTAKKDAVLRMGAQSFTGASGEFSVYSVQSFTDSGDKTPIAQQTLTGTEMHYPVYTAAADGTQILLFKNTGTTHIALTSFEYLSETVTELRCQPGDTEAALDLANALLTPEDPSDSSGTGSLGISAASLTLSSDISINFYVPQENLEGIENPYLLCVKNLYDEKGNVTGTEEKKITLRAENNGRFVYTFDGVSAMEMGSIVTATMHGTKNGKDVSGKPVEYSVKTYAMNQLKRDTTPDKLKTLLVDMLNYGASAQTYWSYNTANLVNQDLTEEQAAFATQTEPTLTNNCTITDNTGTIHFDSVSLLLKEKVAIKYYLSPKGYSGKVSDLTMKVSYVDKNGDTQTETISGDKFTLTADGRYAVIFDKLNPTQMRTVCTAEIYDADGNKVSGTLTYSAESYAARKLSDPDAKLVRLLNDMMKYGDSTAKYFGISSVQVRKAHQAYEICYTYSMDQAKNLEGINSGWQVDNRAGLGKTSNADNGRLSDVSTEERSRLLRYFNNETAGSFDFRFVLSYHFGFAGNVMRLTAEDGSDTFYLITKDDGFYVKAKDGSLTALPATLEAVGNDLGNMLLRVIVDLDKGTSRIEIDGIDCGTHPLLGTSFRCLSFETTDKSTNSTSLQGGYVEANYAIYENFTVPTRAIPTSFTNDNALSLVGESLRLAAGKETASSFEPLGGNVCFTLSTKPERNDQNTSWSLCAGDDAVVKLELKDGYLYANGQKIMKTKAGGALSETQEQLQNNMWHLLRVEADMTTQKAIIKVHTSKVATVDFLMRTSYVDGIRVDNTKSAGFVDLDDIMVYNLVDYDIPEPQVVEDDYNIGINVCSLWENGSHWGWATITPHDDLKPVLGYYDENLTETADWEIKYMAEHGIDFQAFCWYASSSYEPLNPSAKHLDRAFVNAKYSDKMKFCLLWEAANGSVPSTVDAFKNYYVPYIIENYFTNPSYMTIDGKPVLAIFGASRLKSQFGNDAATVKGMFDYLREEARKVGFKGVIVLDCNGGETNIKDYGFDGWYAYNWGTNYTLQEDINNNLNKQKNVDAYTVPTISVGFNHIGWAQERFPMMSVSDFKAANEWVRDTYIPTYANTSKSGADGADHWQEKFAMISTWNEYGEGTYIMPSEGLHGFEYLDVLREVYSGGGTHTDVKPTDEQKALITHNYPQDIRVLRQNGDYTGAQARSVKAYTTDFYQSTANLTVKGNGVYQTYPAGQSSDAIFAVKEEAFKDMDASQLLRVRVKASGIPKGEYMQLFYGTSKSGGISEGNSIRVYSTTDGEQEFVFELSSRSTWIGTVTAMRLDPVDANDVTFTIESVTFEYGGDYPAVYINGTKLGNKIQTETQNGVDYVPFEPGVSRINHLLSLYFEWSYETKTLTLYRNKHSYQFVTGKDYALVDGTTQVKLGGTVYQQDNIPMLPIEGLAKVLGLHCVKDGIDYRISTQEASCFETEADGIWTFNRSGDARGWTLAGGTMNFTDDTLVIEGTRTANNTYDPRLSMENLSLDCSKYTKIEVCVKWDITGSRSSDVMKIYYTTTGAKGLSEGKSVQVPIGKSSNGEFKTLTFDMTKDKDNTGSWKGYVTQLRFDPFDDAGTTEIKYIRFVEAKEETVLVEDDAEGTAKFFVGNDQTIRLVTDPTAAYNKCYYVTSSYTTWLYAKMNTQFTPGATYQIDFDVMLDPNSPAERTDLFCNLQYMDENGKIDHNDHHVTITKNGGWVHFSAQQTVSANSTDRSKDLFTLYSNPYNYGKEDASSCFYYIDNVKVTVVDNASEQLTAANLGASTPASGTGAVYSAALPSPKPFSVPEKLSR